MGAVLKNAFAKRLGHANHESFMDVVEAFFDEIINNDKFIVPLNLSRGEQHPELMLLALGSPDKPAACIVTDVEYAKDFEGGAYTIMSAHDFMGFFVRNKFLEGIIINPYSQYHCFLPREDTLEYMKQNDIVY